jgi:hypothetical protein
VSILLHMPKSAGVCLSMGAVVDNQPVSSPRMFGNVKYVGQSLVEVLVRQKTLALSLTVFASTRFWQSVTSVLCGYQKWHPNPPPPFVIRIVLRSHDHCSQEKQRTDSDIKLP